MIFTTGLIRYIMTSNQLASSQSCCFYSRRVTCPFLFKISSLQLYSLLFFFFFFLGSFSGSLCFGVMPHSVHGLLLVLHSWWDLGVHMGCQELNPRWLHSRQVSYPLYYPFGLWTQLCFLLIRCNVSLLFFQYA